MSERAWSVLAWICVAAFLLTLVVIGVLLSDGCKLYTQPYRVTTAPTVIITGSVPVDEDGGR